MAEYSEAYGKRPVWQWIVIYLVVGGLVYGLVYYFVWGKNGGYNYGAVGNRNTPTIIASPTPSSGS